MYQQEEKLAKLKRQYSKQAIDLAMQGKWQEAVEANKAIVENFPRDVDAYNRLGRAYMELGDYAQAKDAYNHALETDPFNVIAKKNIQRLNVLGDGKAAPVAGSRKVEPQQFIEEIGKAGVVNLFELGPREVRAKMVAGDKVSLRVNSRGLVVENGQGEKLGLVDPRHGSRLLRLMEGGNRYSAAVVSSTEEGMSVIIRETYQHPSQIGRLSFPPKGVEEVRASAERLFKMEEDYREEAGEEPGYTIVGEAGVEVMPEEVDVDEELTNDEE